MNYHNTLFTYLGGTVDGLSFPHHEEQSDAVAVQKHHVMPVMAAANIPDIVIHFLVDFSRECSLVMLILGLGILILDLGFFRAGESTTSPLQKNNEHWRVERLCS